MPPILKNETRRSNRYPAFDPARIGMQPVPAKNFDNPRVPENYPNLIRHVTYAITKEQWQAGK